MQKKKIFLYIFVILLGNSFLGIQMVQAENEDEIVPFIYGEHSSPPGFDPQIFYDTTSSDVAINHLEGLFAYNYTDPELTVIPRLAKDMGSWNPNGTEWTISLREDVRWHDGTKFTADDVKWNWDRLNFLASEGLSQHGHLWFDDNKDLILNHTEVLGDYTIKFVLNEPWMDFFYLQPFSGCFLIQPVEGYEEILIENEESELIFGTGPFVLDNYVAREKVVFIANNEYYRGAPDIQELIFKVYASSTASNNALMSHECHVDGYVRPDNRLAFDMDPDLSYGIQKGSCCYFYHINTHTIPWAARKAMQFAFDYEYTNTILYENRLVEHHSPIPDGMLGYNPNLPGLPYFNLTLARQYLLDDPIYKIHLENHSINMNSSDQDWISLAGADPVEVILFYHYGTGTWAQLIDNMAYIGIKIIDNVGGAWNLWEYLVPDKSLGMGGWCPDYFHPINQVEPIFKTNSSANFIRFSNETIDQWMDEAHLLDGEDLKSKIDQIVTGIIVDNAAAMYWSQNRYVLGWSSKYVSNVYDLFNSAGEKYFYNVQFALSEAPAPTGFEIPGYSSIILLLSTIGISMIIIKKLIIKCKKLKRN